MDGRDEAEDDTDFIEMDDEPVEEDESFFPFNPHLLLMLILIGFFSFFSVWLFSLIFCTAAILASISFFFLRIRSACSDMATSLLGLLPSGLPLDHISARN